MKPVGLVNRTYLEVHGPSHLQAPTVYQFQVMEILQEPPMLMPDMPPEAVEEAAAEAIVTVELGLMVVDMSMATN
jgi:hypothetical protein